MTPAYLVTHSGGFHADELLSSVVLTRLFPAARLIRTRDADWIAPAADRIIYDVGRDYDAERGIFDHHQRDAPLRPSGEPYSSFGLIWKHFGMDYLAALGVHPDHAAAVHASFDGDFVLPIDLMDNGAMSPSVAGPLTDLTLPVLLEALKPSFDDRTPGSDDRAFAEALVIARALVEGRIRVKSSKWRAESMVQDAIRAAGPRRVLELPQGMPFRSAIMRARADHLLFVVHPRDSDWAINGIRRNDDGFELRADLPLAWAGLTDAALEAASGVAGARFCHNARFIAVAATREAALAMAELAVKEAERQEVDA